MPRKYSASFKFEVVRQLQSGERRLAQVCREHDLDPTMVRNWRTMVEKRGAEAFPRSEGEAPTPSPSSGITLAAAEARIGELERLVGQLALENDFLKKAWRRASSRPVKGDN
jgi:transposase-like protein